MRAPPINNLDLSLSKDFALVEEHQVRVPPRHVQRAEPHAVHGRQRTANFASLTDRTITNLPYDASGALVRQNGFGTINGVAPPRTLQLVTRVTF